MNSSIKSLNVKKLLLCVLVGICFYLYTGTENIYAAPKQNKDLVVRIDQVIDDNYPSLGAFVSVTDKFEEPVLSLVKGNFDIMANGKPAASDLNVEGFLYTEEGISFFVLLSASGLMIDEPFNEQKKAAVGFVDILRAQDKLSVYLFGEEMKPVFEVTKKDEKLVKPISDAQLVGGSPKLWDAIKNVGMQMKEEKELRRKVLIVISDGRETDSLFTKEQVFEYLAQNKITVYTIGFEFINIENLAKLEEIANYTGGAYLYASTVRKVADKLKIAFEQITKGYYLKFRLNGIPGDDDYHQLQVTVNHKNAEATSFKNFYAKKGRIELWVVILIIVIIVLVLAAVVILGILFYFGERNRQRKRAGTTQQKKCENPGCGRIKKDDWNECLFCKYLEVKSVKTPARKKV